MKNDPIRDFWRFHYANPKVYYLFDRFTREAMAAGHKHFSAASIIERIRWETTVVTISDTVYKIDNDHRAYYARLWMRDHPEFDGFFYIRKLDSDEDMFDSEDLVG